MSQNADTKRLEQTLNLKHTSTQVLIGLLQAKLRRYVQKYMQSLKSNLPILFLRAFFDMSDIVGDKRKHKRVKEMY